MVKEMTPTLHGSYFIEFDGEFLRKLNLSTICHILILNLIGVVKEMAHSRHKSHFNGFDKELERKWHLSTLRHISINLIRNSKGNGTYLSQVIFH